MAFLLYALAFIVLVTGAPAIFVPKKFVKVVGGIVKNSDLVRMMALRVMFLAFFFLAMYPLLKGGWLLLISITGWIMLLKSVVGLWFPGYLQWKFKTFYKNTMRTIIIGILCVLFAAFLVRAGIMKF